MTPQLGEEGERNRIAPDSETGDVVRILHVEPDGEFARRTAQRLTEENDSFEVQTEPDPREALDRASDVDCVVSAYALPPMDGLELLAELRDTHPDLPFVLLAGEGDEEIASDAISAGVTDYLQKSRIDGQYAVLANRIGKAVEQYRTRRNARREREQRSALFENTPDPVVKATFDDGTPRIEEVNGAFEDVFGFERSSVLGRSVAETLVPNSERGEHRSLRDEVADGDPVEAEVRRRTADGVREFLLRIIPIEEGGVPTGAYAWYTDITERKRHEERLEGLNDASRRLMTAATESEVAETTVDVAQRVLDRPLTAVWSYDPEEEALVPLAAADAAAEFDGSRESDAVGVIPDGTKEMEVFERGEMTVVEDYGRLENPAHPETPLGSVLMAPVGEHGQLHVGARTSGAFDPETRELVEALCQATETAFERVERERTLSELYTVARDLVEASSTEGVATVAAEAGEKILGLPFTHVYLTDDDGDVLRPVGVTDAVQERFGELPRFERGEGVLWDVLEEGEVRLYEDAQAEAELASDLPFRGAVIAPLGDRGAFASGALEPAAFDEFDRKLASILAATTEAALDRAGRERRLRENERELQRAKDRFQSVFKHSNDAIVIFDPEADEILAANPRASDLLGYSHEQLLSLGPSDIHPDEMETFRSFLETVDTEGSGRTDRLSCVTSSGDRVPAEISASTLEFDGRESILALIRDVSELRAYERELERQNERLEEFTSVVSHDLRNPLNVATGHIEFVRQEYESDHLDAVESALDRMEEMIEDLLTLTRVGASVERTDRVRVDAMVEGCWRNVDTTDAEMVTSTEMTIEADESRLRHVFENLFRNAIDHGGPDVRLTVGRLPTGDGFYVADDGPGIPEDERERVFERGYSTAEDGTGFGLSIVKEIVEAHGWELTVTESSEGGARFEIRGVETAGTGSEHD